MAWQEIKNQLYQKLTFKDFSECFSFMTRIAFEAEKMNHHPTWTNSYNSLEIWLTTHSEGDSITEKDHTLAALIDIYYEKL